MLRKLFMKVLCGAGFAAFLAVTVAAQNEFRLGIFVTPVANAPMSATAVFETTRPLPDGSTARLKTIGNIARDSSGRIYNELRRFVPLEFVGTPQLFSSHIFDPTTRVSVFLNPGERIARQSKQQGPGPDWEHLPGLPTIPEAAPGQEPLIRQEDLGTQVMQNVIVHGARTTRTLPANVSGTGRTVVVTHEVWYSDELHLNLLVKHNDPRNGEQTMTVTQLKRGEPEPQLFVIPSDYKVVDETPPQQ